MTNNTNNETITATAEMAPEQAIAAEKEKPNAKPAKTSPIKKTLRNKTTMLIALAVAIGMLIGGLWMACALNYAVGNESASEPAAQINQTVALNEDAETAGDEPADHEHEWVPLYEITEVDAVTEEVEHPAVYEDVTVEHTVCNECNTQIDGVAEQHIAETGHKGYTTNVPFVEPKLVSDPWTETVTVEDAHTNKIIRALMCSVCGEIETGATDGTE